MRNNILFDLDGTIIDPAEGITGAVRHALQSMGYEIPSREMQERFIGPPLNESFGEYYGMDEQQTLQAVKYFREYFASTGLHQNDLYEGFSSLLPELSSKGYNLYIATSKPTKFARFILEEFNLAQHFKGIQGSELDGPGSPKADIIQMVLEKHNISPENAIMVGDRKHDVIGAQKNGIPCIGVLYGYAAPMELQQAGAQHIVNSVENLGKYFISNCPTSSGQEGI